MSKLWKLTDSNSRTRNFTQWGENVSHTATGTGTKLCSDGFIHAYQSKWTAVFMNPVHADFKNPLLWEAHGKIEIKARDLKCGCKTLTTTKQHAFPFLSVEERVKIAIYCALEVYKEKGFVVWAKNWLNNTDRTYAAVIAAYAAAADASEAAYYAAASAANAANAYYAAADAAAADAAAAAANASADFSLLPIIQKVLKQRKTGGAK